MDVSPYSMWFCPSRFGFKIVIVNNFKTLSVSLCLIIPIPYCCISKCKSNEREKQLNRSVYLHVFTNTAAYIWFYDQTLIQLWCGGIKVMS